MEPGDTVSATLKKEFGEEAMNSLEATEAQKKEIEKNINTLFHSGEKVGGKNYACRNYVTHIHHVVTDICWVCG